MYYPCSENKGADQLRGNREADLRLCFRICKKRLSHNEVHFQKTVLLQRMDNCLMSENYRCYKLTSENTVTIKIFIFKFVRWAILKMLYRTIWIHESFIGITQKNIWTNTPNSSVLVPILVSYCHLFPMRRGSGVYM